MTSEYRLSFHYSVMSWLPDKPMSARSNFVNFDPSFAHHHVPARPFDGSQEHHTPYCYPGRLLLVFLVVRTANSFALKRSATTLAAGFPKVSKRVRYVCTLMWVTMLMWYKI